jgi:4-hydroxy-tetrahydrodipicolinate synthase
MVTSMSENGDVDYEATPNLLQWHIDQNTNKLCKLGTTGEWASSILWQMVKM